MIKVHAYEIGRHKAIDNDMHTQLQGYTDFFVVGNEWASYPPLTHTDSDIAFLKWSRKIATQTSIKHKAITFNP